MTTYLAQPMTYVAMDHEATVCHLVAIWTVEGPKAFKALERAALAGTFQLGGDAYLACVLEGPDTITMSLRGHEDWARVIVRQTGLDAVVEIRSRGLASPGGDVPTRDREHFEELVSAVQHALDAVMAPVRSSGSEWER